jgi:hypothetical protein
MSGNRLAENFSPATATQERIRRQYPNLDLNIEQDKFIGYWTEITGARAVKKNWELAFINWCHNAVKFSNSKPLSESIEQRRDKIVAGVLRAPGNDPFSEIAG